MSILERVPKSRENPWETLPKEIVLIVRRYFLAGFSGLRLHAWPDPEVNELIRYSICKQSMEDGAVYDLMRFEVAFGLQLDVLRNNMQVIVSDMDVLKTLPGKDWLTSIHFNFYNKVSMESWSGEIAKFKLLKWISADCFQDNVYESWAKSVHDFLASESPSAKITITSILPPGPGPITGRYIQQLRRSQRQPQPQQQARHDWPSVTTPCITKLAMPSESHPHSTCSHDKGLYLETGVDHEQLYLEKGVDGDTTQHEQETELQLLWFHKKLRRWSNKNVAKGSSLSSLYW